MVTTINFEKQIKDLIDTLKSICANYGLGNDGNEFKIITQVFLYKFLNDKFAYELKKIDESMQKASSWESEFKALDEDKRKKLFRRLGAKAARLQPEYLITHLFDIQNSKDFAKTFDDTLDAIARDNNEIFAVKTNSGAKVKLFDNISEFITDDTQRDNFCRAIINKLVHFSFVL